MALQVRRGTNAERLGITPAEGELIYTIDTKQLYVGDGTTAGGNASIAGTIDSLLADSSPQLGGTLDLNSNDITGTGNIDINGTINATGNINLGDGAGGDIITLGGDIAGDLIPDASDTRNIGSQTRQWNEAWISQLNVNSQVTAERFEGDLIAQDSTVVFNSATGKIPAEQLQGTFTGTVIGNVTGNTTGYHTGDITGSVFADDSAVLIDGISGKGTLLGGLETTDIVSNKIDTLSVIAENNDLLLEANTVNVGAGNANFGAEQSDGTFVSGQIGIKRSGGAGIAMAISTYQNGDNISDIKAVKHRGTIDNPLSYQPNDRTMELVGQAFDGTANRENCFLRFRATGAISNDVAPGQATMNIAETSGSFKVFTFDNDGSFTADHFVSNSGYVQFGSMTTVERDALTAVNGMVIYNTTDNKFQGYENGAWANLI